MVCHWDCGSPSVRNDFLIVSNVESTRKWNCGDTNPVLRDRQRATDRAWLGDLPRYIATLERSDHFSALRPAAIYECKTYTGHPKCCQCLRLTWTLEFEKTSNGTCFRLMSCVALRMSFAVLRAYGQRCASIAEGHLALAWISMVRAWSCNSRIRRSATPF